MYKIYLQVRSKVKASLCLSIYIFYLVDWGKLCPLRQAMGQRVTLNGLGSNHFCSRRSIAKKFT